MITTIEEWEMEYTSDEEWNTHRAKRVSDWGKITDKKIKVWIAEIKWNWKIKKYIVTHYEYRYDENLVKFEILERREYKTRNAMMNRIRKLEEKKKEIEKEIKKEHHHHIQIPKLTYHYKHDENEDKSKNGEQEDQE